MQGGHSLMAQPAGMQAGLYIHGQTGRLHDHVTSHKLFDFGTDGEWTHPMPLSLLEGLPSSLLDAVCLPSSRAACRRRRRRMTRKPAGGEATQSNDRSETAKPALKCPQRSRTESWFGLAGSSANTPAITAASSRRPAMEPRTAPTMAPVFDPLPLGGMPAPRL
jgi:hypothetical protein